MSKELQQFYNELWAWIQAGCPCHEIFLDSWGICGNLAEWAEFNGLTQCHIYMLDDELAIQFALYELDRNFPFGPYELYHTECNQSIVYQNPDRIKWIEYHVSIKEEQN